MPRRRAPGDGSVYRDASGGWRVKLPVRLSDGRRRLIYRRAPTQREAEAKRRELIRQRDAGTLPGLLPSRWTVESYLSHWLTDVITGTVRDSSRQTYRYGVAAIVREIGAVPLDQLTPAHVERCLSAWRTRHAPATVNLYRGVLRAGLEHAHRSGYLTSNPVQHTRPQRARHRDRPWLDAGQALHLVETARAANDSTWPLWALAITTGLGRSELRGLQWRDVDRERRLLYVERQYTRAGLSDLKRDARRRVVPLIPLALEALDAQRAASASVWVFAGTGDAPVGVSIIDRGLRLALTRAGLPQLTPHMLRHSAASIWLTAGVPLKVVSTLLGHSSIGVTANVYTHVDHGLLDAAGAAVTAHFAAVAAAVAAGEPVQITDGPARTSM